MIAKDLAASLDVCHLN